MLTGNKLIINDLEIDGKEEFDPIIFQCFKDAGIDVTQNINDGTLNVEYTPNENSTFKMGETEEDQQTIYIKGSEFDDLFDRIVTAIIENAIEKQRELLQEESNRIDLENPAEIKDPALSAPTSEPSILEQVGNTVSSFFHLTYDAAHNLVCGNKEPEKAVEESKAPKPTR